MAKRGEAAREAVKNKIIEAFGNSFVTIADKKIVVEAEDGPGGEVCQFAITMTMPKTQYEKNAAEPGTPAATPTELSPEDKASVDKLLERLGIENG